MANNQFIDLIEQSGLYDKFSTQFLKKYSESGFGSLSKHDIDLLIFYLIDNEKLFDGKSTYEISNLLSLPESKVKTIQLESYLKYSEKNYKKYLKEIANKIENGELKPELDGEKIKFSLENPIMKRELENIIKKLGHLVDYSFNKDIVSIKLPVFIAALKEIDQKSSDHILKSITKEFKDNQKIMEEIKAKDFSLSSFLKKHAADISAKTVTSILVSLFSALSNIS